MRDLIYIPYKTTESGHNEIRITLRSIEKHCKDIGNLYILGENYGFYSDKVKLIESNFNVTSYNYPFIPIPELYQLVKDNYDNLTDEFSLICDNICFIKDINLEDFPNYWKYNLENCGVYTGKKYTNAETDTYFASKFLAEGRIKNYETAFPLTIDKDQFLRSEFNINYVVSNSKSGIMFRSYYINLTDTGDEELNDNKQYGLDSIIRIKEIYRNKTIPVISMSQQVWSNGGYAFLAGEFPSRSKYENNKIIL